MPRTADPVSAPQPGHESPDVSDDGGEVSGRVARAVVATRAPAQPLNETTNLERDLARQWVGRRAASRDGSCGRSLRTIDVVLASSKRGLHRGRASIAGARMIGDRALVGLLECRPGGGPRELPGPIARSTRGRRLMTPRTCGSAHPGWKIIGGKNDRSGARKLLKAAN